MVAEGQNISSTSDSINIPPHFFTTELFNFASIETLNETEDFAARLWIPFDNTVGDTYHDLSAGNQFWMNFEFPSFNCDVGDIRYRQDLVACTGKNTIFVFQQFWKRRMGWFFSIRHFLFGFDSIVASRVGRRGGGGGGGGSGAIASLQFWSQNFSKRSPCGIILRDPCLAEQNQKISKGATI